MDIMETEKKEKEINWDYCRKCLAKNRKLYKEAIRYNGWCASFTKKEAARSCEFLKYQMQGIETAKWY